MALLLWQFGIAPVICYLTARATVVLYNRLVPEDRGYYYLLFLSVLVQGSTLVLLVKWLRLSEPARSKPLASLELYTMAHTDYGLVVVEITESLAKEGPIIG